MEERIERLVSQLEQRGLRGRVVAIDRLRDLEQDIVGRHAQGLFDEDFYHERLTFFDFNPPARGFTARSLIVVAMPRPQTRVAFTWQGTTRSLILPPTYLEYDAIDAHIQRLLAELLAPQGYQVAPTRLPLKTLAVRSGLGDHGRNNICYVPGMGSFLQLAACYSDLPCEQDEWRDLTMMDKCENCRACQIKCPTQAIPTDRFLLRAERCIVFLNERPPDHPLPDWLDLSAHDCLVGCMVCQRFCPVDKPFLGWFEGDEEFSDEETAALLAGASRDQLPAGALEKLERLEILDYLEVLPRNLRAVFHP
jgi:epoxyqueuosine reductase